MCSNFGQISVVSGVVSPALMHTLLKSYSGTHMGLPTILNTPCSLRSVKYNTLIRSLSIYGFHEITKMSMARGYGSRDFMK